jgi:hypothetical protein
MPKLIFTGAILSFLAIFAPFFFSWPYSFGIAGVASVFFPPVAVLSGALIDTLYFEHGASHSLFILPYFTILGCIVGMIAFSVQQFVKTRIMS